MKKFNFISAAIAIVIATVMTIVCWCVLVPAWMHNGAVVDAELRDYIVKQMPELEGADASDITFDTNGVYHANYQGKSYIINDSAIQSNIAAFEKDFWSCNYVAGVKTEGTAITACAWLVGFFPILTGTLEVIDLVKEHAKKKKEALEAANVTT